MIDKFERVFVAAIAMIIGFILIYLGYLGPLFLDLIQFKTHATVVNQLLGQDIVNMFVLSGILIAGGILLLAKKRMGVYLLIMTPLYLFYYAISYALGWEWMAPDYVGNSQNYFFYFLAVIVGGLIIMLYCLSAFPKKVTNTFRKGSLRLYSVFYVLFLLIFASMWIKEIVEVMNTGTTRGYDIAPTAFWLVRTIDLGFCLPLGLISIYLLWTRPNQSYAIQFLFYGFFVTQILAVNSMSLMMYLHHDPLVTLSNIIVFLVLLVILFAGFIYIIRNYKVQ
ncbi:MAG: hypothetical protein CVU48_00480 [Candidatus Cloacimonetes bacterium HGW-Cloacimonetes-1]|jgi:hypothetical protein|nr:MAG: hypothetical protein CVU48_00480 [Candidatus Cloacimonetes bacterium HGW-Cloacimonetes-1]